MSKKLLSCIILFFTILIIITPIHAENNTTNNTYSDFTELNSQINTCNESTLKLNTSYISNDNSPNDGIIISKNITINGQNNTIDANYNSRNLMIESYCNVILENIIFKNGYTTENGGGILLKSNSNLTIKNCIFQNNQVYNSNGGAIHAQSGTNVQIINSLFENNTSIRESDLEWEEYKKGMGSAICLSINSNLKLYNTTFRKNNAYLSTILVVSYNDIIYELSTLYIKNCVFENNTSKRSGVIYLDELGYGEIHDSVFKNNNIIETSGTVILESSVYALIKNCTFESNSAIRGGAINLKYFNETGSNVTVMNCNFTGNFASITGGAIYSNHGHLTVINSNFNNNEALANGGGIYVNEGITNIYNSTFTFNTASYGGALSLSGSESSLHNSIFISNAAAVKGGAIYSKIEDITQENLSFKNNTSPKGIDIYGIINAQIKVMSKYFDDVELKISLTSPWNMSLSQKIKIKFIGEKTFTTSWLSTNDNGELTVKLPSKLNVDTYTIEVTAESCFINPELKSMKVSKSPCKITVKKITTTYKSGKTLKFYIINTKTGRKVQGAKLLLKVYTGKKYKSYTLTSDKNGLIKFDTGKIGVGKHTIKITSKNSNIKLSTVKSTITIKKATGKLSYKKTVKKGSKLKITVKNKGNGKVIKKTRFTIKIKSKTFKVKTNSKGVLKIKSKYLKKGKNKITVTYKSKNYNINKKITVKVK